MSESIRTGASFGKGVITPSDTVDVGKVDGQFPRGLKVNGAGDVAIEAIDGTRGIWTCAGPEVIGFQVKRVLATGTTATGIYPIY